jgi:hypothetical protein
MKIGRLTISERAKSINKWKDSYKDSHIGHKKKNKVQEKYHPKVYRVIL